MRERLRGLPHEQRPPFDWVEFRRRAERPQRDAVRFRWQHAALAASVAGAVLAVAVWLRMTATAPDDRIAETSAAPRAATSAWREGDATAGWLAALPAEPAIIRVDTRIAVTDLEDSIAWVDELLTLERAQASGPSRLMALQQERSRLVDSLARVRYAETLAAEVP